MRWFWTLAIVALLATGVIAEPAAQAPVDSRLDAKVTLEVDHAKLEDALKQLSTKSGVEIKAGSGERDWKVRERRITVRAKDVTLKSLMDEISGMLGYRVTRGGKEGQWSYLIWQDKKARDLEEEMVASAKEAAAQRAMKTRQGALDAAQEALKMSPDDAMKMKDKNPWMAYLGGTKAGRGFATLLSGLGNSFGTERDLMLRGRRVSFPLSGLPPTMAAAASDTTTGGIFGAIAKMGGGMPGGMTPSEMTVMPIGDMGGAGAGMLGFSGLVVVTGTAPGMPTAGADNPFGNGIPMSMFPLSSGDSVVGNVFGKLYFALDEGASLQDAMTKMQAEAMNPDFLADSLARESETEKNPPTDPEMTREVELKGVFEDFKLSQDTKASSEMQAKAVEEIARVIGKPVMMESFKTSLPIPLFVKGGKQPLYKIMVGLEKGGYVWSMDDGYLKIRPEDWALQRSYEIPESFIQMCKATLQKQGMFTLDDMAYIVTSLTDDQIQNSLIAESDLTMALASLITPMGSTKDILRVYGSLNVQQKAAIKTPAGLAFAKLNNDQWEHLGTLVNDRLGGVYIADGTLKLKAVEMPKPKTPAPAQVNAAMMAGDSQIMTFEVNVMVGDEAKPRSFKEPVILMGKEQIAALKKTQQAAIDAAQKSADQKKAGQKPAPAPKK